MQLMEKPGKCNACNSSLREASTLLPILSLTLVWVLVGVLEEAAQDDVHHVDSLIGTLPQRFDQLGQVLLHVRQEETHWVWNWRLNYPVQGLEEQK